MRRNNKIKKSCLFPRPSKGGKTDSFYFIQIFRNLLDDLLSSNNHGESLSKRMEAAATHVIDNVIAFNSICNGCRLFNARGGEIEVAVVNSFKHKDGGGRQREGDFLVDVNGHIHFHATQTALTNHLVGKGTA